MNQRRKPGENPAERAAEHDCRDRLIEPQSRGEHRRKAEDRDAEYNQRPLAGDRGDGVEDADEERVIRPVVLPGRVGFVELPRELVPLVHQLFLARRRFGERP